MDNRESKSGGYLSIQCPNIRPHMTRNRDGSRGRFKDTCDAILKIYYAPAVFEEILFCPVCKAHWRVTSNMRGAVRATLIPDQIRMRYRPAPMHVIGAKLREQRGHLHTEKSVA